MIECQAQRTIVKSPPELWAELSDAATLARHLNEIGDDIRITRVVPETTVVWEGEQARGTVELTPSGWGTKVTLTLRHDEAQPPPEPEPPESEPSRKPEPPREERPPEPRSMPEPRPVPDAPAIPQPRAITEPPPPAEPRPLATPAARSPMARGSLWARFRRRRDQPSPAQDGTSAPDSQAPPEPATEPASKPEPRPEPATELLPDPEPQPGPEPELPPATGPVEAKRPTRLPPLLISPQVLALPQTCASSPTTAPTAPSAEGLDPARTDALLNGILDSLGAAHHRPFSRS